LPPEHPDLINFSRNSPLKIRGVRGVMKIMEITPFNPPYFKGEIQEENPYLKGEV